eukprot:80496-Amphidinium_carterae.1
MFIFKQCKGFFFRSILLNLNSVKVCRGPGVELLTLEHAKAIVVEEAAKSHEVGVSYICLRTMVSPKAIGREGLCT